MHASQLLESILVLDSVRLCSIVMTVLCSILLPTHRIVLGRLIPGICESTARLGIARLLGGFGLGIRLRRLVCTGVFSTIQAPILLSIVRLITSSLLRLQLLEPSTLASPTLLFMSISSSTLLIRESPLIFYPILYSFLVLFSVTIIY